MRRWPLERPGARRPRSGIARGLPAPGRAPGSDTGPRGRDGHTPLGSPEPLPLPLTVGLRGRPCSPRPRGRAGPRVGPRPSAPPTTPCPGRAFPPRSAGRRVTLPAPMRSVVPGPRPRAPGDVRCLPTARPRPSGRGNQCRSRPRLAEADFAAGWGWCRGRCWRAGSAWDTSDCHLRGVADPAAGASGPWCAWSAGTTSRGPSGRRSDAVGRGPPRARGDVVHVDRTLSTGYQLA